MDNIKLRIIMKDKYIVKNCAFVHRSIELTRSSEDHIFQNLYFYLKIDHKIIILTKISCWRCDQLIGNLNEGKIKKCRIKTNFI